MAPFYTDTQPEVEALQIELLRSTPPWRKMEILTALNSSARVLAMAGLRQRHPQASEADLRRRFADLMLGSEMAGKIYPEINIDA